MAGLDRIVVAVPDHGIGAAIGVVVVVLLYRAGRILVDNYTKLMAETAWLTISNWLVAITAAMLVRRPPGLAETIAEQLDWLESYHADGIVGFRLLRHAADLAIHMHTTASAKGQVARQQHEAADLATRDENVDEPAVDATVSLRLPTATGEVTVEYKPAAFKRLQYGDASLFSAIFADSPAVRRLSEQITSQFAASVPKVDVSRLFDLPRVDTSQFMPKIDVAKLSGAHAASARLVDMVNSSEAMRAARQASRLNLPEAARAARMANKINASEAARAARRINDLNATSAEQPQDDDEF